MLGVFFFILRWAYLSNLSHRFPSVDPFPFIIYIIFFLFLNSHGTTAFPISLHPTFSLILSNLVNKKKYSPTLLIFQMKCVFPTPASNQENAQQQSCQRCLAGKYPCVVEGRKPRTPSRREWLLAQVNYFLLCLTLFLCFTSPCPLLHPFRTFSFPLHFHSSSHLFSFPRSSI